MRPACFCAYIRWSAIRSASDASVVSRGSETEPYEQPIQKPVALLGERERGAVEQLPGVRAARLEQRAELVAAHPEHARAVAEVGAQVRRRGGRAGRRRRGGRRCRCSA